MMDTVGSRRGRRGRGGRGGRPNLPGLLLPLLPLLPLVGACGGAGPDHLVTIPGTGFVGGFVYLDADGSRSPGGPDVALPGVGVRLVVAGTIDTVSRATSDANGGFVFGALPVGRYTVVVPDAGIFGDSLLVTRIDTSAIALGVNDTSQVEVAVSYPAYTVAEARQRPIGEKFFVEGLALNNRPVFADTTVHLRDTTGALRITRASGPIAAAGDSIRFLGKAGARDGQPVLDEAQATILQIVSLPVPVRVTTAVAATADSARLDADLVRIVNGTINDTTTVNGDYVATVDDGSGAVLVVFDQDAGLTQSPYVPTVVIDATGVLVPDGLGRWVIKPRANTDVVLR